MKNMSIKSKNTLISDDTDISIVCKSDVRPGFVFESRKTLVTRRTLMTLASYGPTESTLPEDWRASGISFRPTSMRLDITTKKSNLFHAVSKYDLPYANSFKHASTKNMKVNM
jgi:hypothetical protein